MRHEVITGDNVTEMRRMDADTFDLCVTSPPYDNLRRYQGYSFDFEATAKELYRVIKPGGVVVWVVGDATVDGSETGTSFRQALFFKDECGFNLHDTMIYEKEGLTMNHNRYEQSFEFMFVLSKGRPKTFNPIMVPCRYHGKDSERAGTFYAATDERFSKRRGGKERNNIQPEKIKGNIWRYHTGSGHTTPDAFAFAHPAMFPERLAADHILSWSNEGDTVLDPFCGSGTTGKMAVITKRNFVGIEISEEYAALSRARIKRASGEWAEIPRLNRRQIETPLFGTA